MGKRKDSRNPRGIRIQIDIADIIKLMSKLLLASNNKGKIHEFRSLLREVRFELVTPAQQAIELEVEETGNTYEENARLKAMVFAKASGLLTLADDSGLEVDALNGAPGIRSSRYAGKGATDTERINFLLANLKDTPLEKRTAQFVCVIAIAFPGERIEICSGKCDGIIISEPRGERGFGYDPIFYFPEFDKTMSELPEETKNQVSHRARAAREAVKILNRSY
jgi:XTP/dITP diphosphohydrolase